MATTDVNGQVFYGPTDPVEPLQGLLNGISTANSGRLSSEVQIKRVANVTGRTAAVTARSGRPITVSDPLFVWREDAPENRRLEYTINGTTWRVYGDNGRTPYIIAGSGSVVTTGVTGTFTLNIPDVPADVTVWPILSVGCANANYGTFFSWTGLSKSSATVRYNSAAAGLTIPYHWSAMYVQAGV